MATIENRGHCQFRAKIRKRGHKTITKTFNNRRDAEAWARSVEAEYDRKGFLPSLVAHRMTFRQAGERYREEVSLAWPIREKRKAHGSSVSLINLVSWRWPHSIRPMQQNSVT